jgi:hypothetical protein
MTHFFAHLFHLLYAWQKKYFGNEKHGALYASAAIGILFGMNFMLISYLASFQFFDKVISFLRSYYIFTAFAIVLITIFVLLFNKRYEKLLVNVSKQKKHIHTKYSAIVFVYIVITILGYAFANYSLFNDIYFGQ